jgi:CrcB protein
MKYLWVGLGGCLGAIARYALGVWIYERMGTRFPYGTFVINISGCFLIGLTLAVLDARTSIPRAWREAVPIGFIGAYTTFSTFEYETLRAAQQGQSAVAVGYLLSSIVIGFGAVWVGQAAGRLLT